MKFFASLFFLLFPSFALAQYQYGGTYNTARVAYHNQATMIQTGTLNCKKCWSIGWIILWDSCPDNPVVYCNPAERSENYVEAGIGQSIIGHWTKAGEQKTALWYASNSKPYGIKVGELPTGTPITVSMTKADGERAVMVRWDWPGGTKSLSVPVAGWLNGPGIHPVKAEMYGKNPPVNLRFEGVPSWGEDVIQGVRLEAEGPYHVTGTLQNFTITGP